MSEALDLAKELRDEPGRFSVRDHLAGSSHATDTVVVFTDGQAGWDINAINNDLMLLERKIASPAKASRSDSITDGDDEDDLYEKHEALQADLEAAVGKALESALTFHVRGVPYKQLDLIFKKARKAIKPPARKNYADGADGEEEYNLETLERNIERNDLINYLTIATSIVKVVDAHGNEDQSAWDADSVEDFRTSVYDSEYTKLKNAVDKVTLAQGIFTGVVNRDADFLSKR